MQYPCLKCAIGYVLNGSLCYARRCLTYKSNRDCLTCINYYSLVLPTNNFCILYNCNNPSCYESDAPPSGFYIDGNNSLQISYCIRYNQANCILCSNYRYPNPNVLFGLCYPWNCAINSLIDCRSCLPGYSYLAGTCVSQNCSVFNSNGSCSQCIAQYKLVNSSCVIITIPGCQLINYLTSDCSSCFGLYSLRNGMCIPNNCQQYNLHICQQCSQGFFLSLNGTCQIAKCKTSDNSGSTCLICLLGYLPQSGLCVANNCSKYDWSSMVCIKCANGFALVSNIGICKATNCNNVDSNLVCTSCENGYELQIGNFCTLKDLYCVSYDSNRNCTACISSNYTPYLSTCIPTIPGCQEYSLNGCLRCLQPYNLNSGKCFIKYCQNYIQPHICSICQPRYQFSNNGFCLPLNCLNFDSITYTCSKCEPRFRLQDAICSALNCTNFINNSCKTCASGFILVG